MTFMLRGEGFWEERFKTLGHEFDAFIDTPEVWNLCKAIQHEMECWAIREHDKAVIGVQHDFDDQKRRAAQAEAECRQLRHQLVLGDEAKDLAWGELDERQRETYLEFVRQRIRREESGAGFKLPGGED